MSMKRSNLIEQHAIYTIKRRRTPTPKLLLKTRSEIAAFIAGIASACHTIFGRPVTERQAAACLFGEKEFMGGAFIVLESLDDDGVLAATPNGTYELTAPIGISPELIKSQYEAIINTPIRYTPPEVRYEVAEDGE
jgi:hypothetical protein